MPLFRCLIRGENFPGQLIGQKALVGFYTTRFVEAENVDQAESSGLQLLRDDPALQIKSEKLGQRQPPAMVYFEEIVEVDPATKQAPNKGATWFDMDSA